MAGVVSDWSGRPGSSRRVPRRNGAQWRALYPSTSHSRASGRGSSRRGRSSKACAVGGESGASSEILSEFVAEYLSLDRCGLRVLGLRSVLEGRVANVSTVPGDGIPGELTGIGQDCPAETNDHEARDDRQGLKGAQGRFANYDGSVSPRMLRSWRQRASAGCVHRPPGSGVSILLPISQGSDVTEGVTRARKRRKPRRLDVFRPPANHRPRDTQESSANDRRAEPPDPAP